MPLCRQGHAFGIAQVHQLKEGEEPEKQGRELCMHGCLGLFSLEETACLLTYVTDPRRGGRSGTEESKRLLHIDLLSPHPCGTPPPQRRL